MKSVRWGETEKISYTVKKMYLISNQYNIYLASIDSFRAIMFVKSWEHRVYMKM